VGQKITVVGTGYLGATHAVHLVRAAQGRDAAAETLLREAEEILRPTAFRRHQIAPLEALAEFLRARDRDDEAVEVEEELAALLGTPRVEARTTG